jgi:hypothetical protein
MSLMKKRLFEPFRFGFWSRIAVLGVLAGELSTSGKGGGGGQGGTTYHPSSAQGFDPTWIAQHWNFILGGIVVAAAVGLLLFYISSVLRFVLYEAVLRDRAHIREGFARWREHGLDYFTFRLMLVVPFAALAVYLVGLPVIQIIKAGGGGPEIILAFRHLASALLLVVTFGVLLAVALLMTKDFVVPQMMLEGVSCADGWRRLWPQIKAEPTSFMGYILLKIVMAIAAAVALAIGLVIAVIVALIPAGIVAGIGFFIFKTIGGGIPAIAALVALGIVFLLPAIIYCIGFVGAPISVFFPAYSMQFFASRYAPLYKELYPQPSGGQV